MQPLSPEQVEHYRNSGFVLADGLIPDGVARAAELVTWDLLGMNPDDPSTWNPHPPHCEHYTAPGIIATYTPELLAAAEQLAAVGRNREKDGGQFEVPTRVDALNKFPQEGVEWKWPGWHVDHSIREHGHKTFPRAYRIAAMTYLNDCVPHCGNTIVWPEAVHRIWDEIEKDRDSFTDMWQVGAHVKMMDLGEPLELVPKRGQVLFYDVMCAHAGSQNTADRPRLAINTKW